MESKEVVEKGLALAKKALENNKICFAPTASGLVEEFTALEIGDSEEIRLLLLDLIKEIQADNYVHLSRQELLLNPNIPEFDFVFNFIWNSEKLRKKMRIRFAVNDECFCYFSLTHCYR